MPKATDVCTHSFSPNEWNLLIEVFATAMVFTQDETGDFYNDARDLALRIGIFPSELKAMIETVKEASRE